MANKNTGKHIALTVGANTGLSIGQMRNDLRSITKAINQNPPEIKVKLATSSITSLQREIQNAINTGKYTVNFTANPSGGKGSGQGYDYLSKQLYKINKEYYSTPWNDDAYTAKMQQKGAYIDLYKKKVAELGSALTQLGATENADIYGIDASKHAPEIEQIINLYRELKIAKKAATDVNFDQKEAINLNREKSKAFEYYNKYGASISRNPELNQRFQSLLNGNMNSSEFKKELSYLQMLIRSAGLEVESFGQKVKNTFNERIKMGAISAAFSAFAMIVRRVYQSTKELDSALTDLQIATGYSKEATRGLLAEYSVLAQKLGATTVEVANAADAWLRQGYSAKEANTLIKNSMMLSKLGQIDSAEATTALTSAMKGYNLTVDDTTSIVDKLTAVDMEAAVSAGDLAVAMAETNTGARIAGVDMDRLIGYISTVAEVTQDGAESVGTFYKTLFARMGNIKAGQLVDPETSEDLSNVENVLKGVGIALRENGGEFRNFGEVLDEVHSKWDNYGTVQQRAIAVAFAGTRQQEKFLTLMEHYSEAMGYAEIATNSAGTALEKYESAYLTSAEAAQNRLTASFEEFAQTILSSATLIDGFSFLSELTVSATGATKTLGGLKGVIATLISVATILNIKKLGSGISGILGNAKNGSSIIGVFSNAVKVANTNLQVGKSRASVFTKTLIEGFTGVSGAAATATAAISVVTLLISGAIILWQRYKQSQEEARQAAVEAADAHNEIATSLETYKSRISELRTELDSNTISEENAYAAREELMKIQEDLIDKFGLEAQGIDLVTGSIKDQIEALEELIETDWYPKYSSNTEAINKSVDILTGESFGIPTNTGVNVGKDVLDNILKGDSRFIVRAGTTSDSSSITLSSEVDNIYDQIEAYEHLHRVMGEISKDTSLSEHQRELAKGSQEAISDTLKIYRELLSDNEENLNFYAEGILAGYTENDAYTEYWTDLTEAREKYTEAVKNGDDEKEIAKHIESMRKAKEGLESVMAGSDSDAGVNTYLENYFDGIEATIDNFDTTQLQKEVTEAAKMAIEMRNEFEKGSVDLTIRPRVEIDGGYETVDSVSFTKWVGSEEDGHYVQIHATPILPNGHKLTDDALETYINELVSQGEDIVINDTNSVVLKVDDLSGLSIEDVENQTEAFKEATAQAGEWDNALHLSQEAYYDTIGSVEEYANSIREAYKDNEYLSSSFEGLTDEQVINFFIRFTETVLKAGDAAGKTADSVRGVSDALSTLDSMSNAGDAMNKIIGSLKDGEGIGFDNIAKLSKELKELGVESDEYINKILDADGDINKVQEALSDATNEIINNKIASGELTAEHEKALAVWLESIGVIDAEAVAHEKLTKKITLTSEEYDHLCNELGETVKATKIAENAYEIEEKAITDLGSTFKNVAEKIALIQTGLTDTTIEECKNRIKAFELEKLAYLGAEELNKPQAYESSKDKNKFPETELDYDGMPDNDKDFYNTQLEIQKYKDAVRIYQQTLDKINALNTNPITFEGDQKDTDKKNDDPILDAWKEDVAKQKHLLEMDKQTKEQYYKWLSDNYKKRLTDTKKYADELRSIEEELYNWEKEKIDENIASETAKLENDKLNGLISEKEYNQKLKQLYDDGYNDLQRATKEYQLYGVDNTERLEKENEYLEQYKENHIACYEAEHEELEHALDMNLISQEEYLQELQRLYAEYYQGNPMYAEQAKDIEKEIRDAYVGAYEERHKELDHALKMNLMTEEMYLIELYRLYQEYYAGNEAFADEAMAAEEELFEQMTSTIEKWAQAAADAVEAIADAASETVQAVTDLIHNSIDTHEENFNLEKKALDHALAMNYISEEEYYNSLESLYKTYFRDKNMYTEQYWENQEEVYKHEQDMLKESADAVEDIHAEVVDMIKDELEETIDAIDKAKDAYLDLIDIRREALNEQKDEDDYNEEREERINDISELQRQLNALANDTSAEGIRKYKEIQQQLRDAQKDLEELEEDHAYELMNKELDNEASATEKAYDNKKSELEALLDNNKYLVDEAWARLSDKNSNLYNELIEHNKKYSTSIKDDITDSWNTATKALQGYADAKAGYRGIVGEIGKTGMTDGDYQHSQNITDAKQAYNWVKVALEFAGSMLSVAGGLMGSMMSIAGVFLPQPFGSLVSIGGGMMGAFSGVGGAVLGALGSFASGTNYVPKTGVYETDEFGREELKFLKSPHNGRYTMLTEGSKVISGEGTERLWRLANNPNLFTGGGTNSVNVSNLKDIVSSIPVSNSQTSSISNTFYIKSSNPQDVAAEIEKLMPKIANYTIGNMVSGSNNNGVKRKIQHLY